MIMSHFGRWTALWRANSKSQALNNMFSPMTKSHKTKEEGIHLRTSPGQLQTLLCTIGYSASDHTKQGTCYAKYLKSDSPFPSAERNMVLIHVAHVKSLACGNTAHLLKHPIHSHKCVIITLHYVFCWYISYLSQPFS